MGLTTNRDIPIASSLVDYIFRWLGMEFIPGYREENAPRREEPPVVARTEQAESRADALAGRFGSDSASQAIRHEGVRREVLESTLMEETSWNDGSSEEFDHGADSSAATGEDVRPRTPGREDRIQPASGRPHRTGNRAVDGVATPESTPNRQLDARQPSAAPGAGQARIGASPRSSSSEWTVGHGTSVRSAASGSSISSGALAASEHSELVAERTSTTRTIVGPVGVITAQIEEFSLSTHAATSSGASAHAAALMGDAPACANCGHITIRSGACYKCLNCGAQNGCG